MANMKTTRIGILGCGALGSRIALGLARPNTSLFLVDDDKVESDNIGTSIYGRRDEGKFKVKALLEHIDSVIGRSVVDISARRFPSKPIIKILEDYNVIVDCFDNAESRNSITACKSPVCHVALASPDYGEVIWHRDFIVIEDERVGWLREAARCGAPAARASCFAVSAGVTPVRTLAFATSPSV